MSALLVGFLLAAPPAASAAQVQDCLPSCVGPMAGSLLLAGGGLLGDDIVERFIELAGGPDAPIVVIPTATTPRSRAPHWLDLELLRHAGARNLTLLHTRNRHEADSEEFTRPLREATGIWISGGQQWRLVETYLGTQTEVELHLLLARGGVVGGSSAGASIMASYLVRGGTQGNQVVMAPGYEDGFGFLEQVAVDQHLTARERQFDLLGVVSLYPHLLGIGIDEGTAVVVRGDRAQVIGRGSVTIYDEQSLSRLITRLDSGDEYDLARRLPRFEEDRPTATASDRESDRLPGGAPGAE